jgi:hypothetical protein
MYIYVKRERLLAVRGLDRLGAEFTSSAALGPEGYLLAMGFVPLDIEDMIRSLALVHTLPPLMPDALPE